MTNRREFLQTGVSVTALPIAMAAARAADAASARGDAANVVLHKALFDDRYAQGRAFAEAITALGVRAEALDAGDVTRFWYEELDPLWRERPAAIAGLTQLGPLFVLERLGRERGLRVALRVEHEVRSDGTLTHAITAPPDTLALADRLRQQGVGWPVLMAALAARCRADCAAPVARAVTMPGAKPALTENAAASASDSVIHYYTPLGIQEGRGVPWDGPLCSWVIAPAASRST